MARNERALIKQNVANLLDQLGSTPRTVAETLQRSGVRGDPFLSSRCPLAEYLHAVVGADAHVSKVKVGLHVAVISRPRRWRPIIVPLPVAVRLFVLGFDNGHYPALIRHTEPGGIPIPSPSTAG